MNEKRKRDAFDPCRWFILLGAFLTFLGTAPLLWGQVPGPVLNTLNPIGVLAGGSTFNLTVTGSGFTGGLAGSGLLWNGQQPIPTTIVSDTQAVGTVPATFITTAGYAQVRFDRVGATAIQSSNSIMFYIYYPIASISPEFAMEGQAGATLTVNGSFTPMISPAIFWNGVSRNTIRLSPTQVQMLLSAADLATAGTATVQVIDQYFNGDRSNIVTFTIDPALSIASLNPPAATVGSPAFTLTVNGTGFRPEYGSTLQWNGTSLATTVVSLTRLTAVVPAAELAALGWNTLAVYNSSLQRYSNFVSFQVTPLPPGISSLGPPSVLVGSGAFTLTVNGSNFLPPTMIDGVPFAGSTVRWNGADRPTTFVSATQLTAAIPASDVATAGTVSITVSSEAQDGGVSPVAAFAINNPVPSLTGVSPGSRMAGASGFTLTANGTNFVNGSVVRWNGSSRNTTLVSSTQLTAAILAADLSTAGNAEVTVFNPGPGGGSSSPVSFSIAPPLSVTAGPVLAQAIAGASYSATLTATGGFPPYSWRVVEGGLPGGLSLDGTTGVLSGTPAAAGTFSFQVAVSDSQQNSSSSTLTITINPALPAVSLTGLPNTVTPAQQPSVGVALASAYSLPLTGQLTLTFAPNAVVPSDDPAIQFATGGRTVNFTLPANSTQAVFSNGASSVAFQTGTVAGTITINVSMLFQGGNVPLNPNPSRNLVIPRQTPFIADARIVNKSGTGFELQITAYSTPRVVSLANFYLGGVSGGKLKTQVLSSDLGPLLTTWYRTTESSQYGSQFKLVVPFTIQGNPNDIATVGVLLINEVGYSLEKTIDFASGNVSGR